MEVKAPGVVKLLGEHAVVYGRLAIAMGVNLYAKAVVTKPKQDKLTIKLSDLNLEESFDQKQLSRIYKSYLSRTNIDSYISEAHQKEEMLPFLTIAARIQGEIGAKVTGMAVKISSDIPIKKGLASSASLSTAFAVAVLKSAGIKPEDSKIIDIARDGDRVVHKNENAGRIDVGTAFYGGYTSYSSKQGTKKEDISAVLKFLIIDTGPKKSTAETVGHVASLHKSDKNKVERILDQINGCSEKGIEALKANNIKGLGEFMFKDHELLKQLEVSTEGLDKAIDLAKRHGSIGAKLSGGGGGGIAVALVKGFDEKLIAELKGNGFDIIEAKVSMRGASDYLS